MERNKKLLLLGGTGIAAIALMSFGKLSKVEDQNQLEATPEATPELIPNIPDIVFVPDPVVITDPIINDVIIEPINYVDPNKELTIEIVNRVSSSFVSTKQNLVLDLKFTNYTDNEILLSSVKKISANRADGSKTLGVVAVSFADIKIQPEKSIILNDVHLNGLVSDYFTYTPENIYTRLSLSPIFGAIDENVIIDAPDIAVNEEYLVTDKNIIVYPITRNSSKYNAGSLEVDWNVIIENNTDEDFLLNTVKAIKTIVLFGTKFYEVSITPFNFSNYRIKAHEQLVLQNLVVVVPYNIFGEKVAATLAKSFNTDIKLELLF